MIMRINWGRVQPGTWKDYEETFRAVAVVKSRNVEGIRARWLVQDLDDPDAGFAVSLWDSLDDIRHYEGSRAREEILAALQSYHTGEFKVNHCDVKVIEGFSRT